MTIDFREEEFVVVTNIVCGRVILNLYNVNNTVIIVIISDMRKEISLDLLMT